MKMLGWMLAVTLTAINFGIACGSPTAADPAPGTVYEFFKLGELSQSLTDHSYYLILGDKLKTRFEDQAALMKKLKVSSESTAHFEKLTALALELPFQKERDWDKWREADRERWRTEGNPTWKKLLTSLKTDMEKDPTSEFFYWLGAASLYLAWILPTDIAAGLQVSETNAKTFIATFVWLRDNKVGEQLAPGVVVAIKEIAAMQAKIDDPIEGIGKADVKRISEQAQLIRDAAKEQELLN